MEKVAQILQYLESLQIEGTAGLQNALKESGIWFGLLKTSFTENSST